LKQNTNFNIGKRKKREKTYSESKMLIIGILINAFFKFQNGIFAL